MKRSLWILLTAASLMIATLSLKSTSAQDKPAAPASAPAAEVQPAKTAVCNLLTVLKNYDHGNDLTKELNARNAKIKAEAEKRGVEIKKIEQSLEDLKTGSKEYDAQLNKMTQLAIDQQAYVNFQDEMAKRDTLRYTKELYQEVLDGVEKVAKEKGYQLVLFKETPNPSTQKLDELLEQIARRKVLYSDPAMDITDDVLKRVNRDYALKKQ